MFFFCGSCKYEGSDHSWKILNKRLYWSLLSSHELPTEPCRFILISFTLFLSVSWFLLNNLIILKLWIYTARSEMPWHRQHMSRIYLPLKKNPPIWLSKVGMYVDNNYPVNNKLDNLQYFNIIVHIIYYSICPHTSYYVENNEYVLLK